MRVGQGMSGSPIIQDGKLYGKADEEIYPLYPIGENTFGRKGAFTKIVFGEDCLIADGVVCRKTECAGPDAITS